MTVHHSLAVFAELSAALQHAPDEVVTGQVVVTRMRDLLPEAERVSLTVRAPRRTHTTLARTDGVAGEIDALQYALGQGPCHLTVGAGTWIRSGDVDTDARWPCWGPRVADLGVRSLLSVALTDRDEPIGALHLYSGAPGAFADRDCVDLALAYAVLAATALSFARRTTTMQAAVSSRHVIGMAQGIAMERYDLDQPTSFELLRRLSSTTNVKLRDVATQIVETGAITDTAPRPRPVSVPPLSEQAAG